METFRFRVTRPVDRLLYPSQALSVTADKSASTSLTHGQAYAISNFLGASGPAIAIWLVTVTDRLAQSADLADPATLISWLPGDWHEQAVSAAWGEIGTTLGNVLLGAFEAARKNASIVSAGASVIRIVRQDDITAVEAWSRLLLLHDLITTLAAEYGKPDEERTIVTAEDVQAALNFRHVTLPVEFFSGSKPVLARQPGVTDFYIVRDEWNRYIAGEVAAVTNVLPGEMLEHRTGELIETEITKQTSDTKTTTTVEEHSQTTSQSLSITATSEASLNIGVQGQVETSGQYGPTQVQTSLGAQLQASQTNSNSRAITTAVETVDRAVKTVSETVSATKTTRTLQRTTTGDKHALENKGPEVRVGLYRWLSSVHRMQLERYPNRFVLEFQIPEPGAWLRWALQGPRGGPWDSPDPGEFTLKASDINPDPASDTNPNNWQALASKWGAQGLTPPPPDLMTISAGLAPDKMAFIDDTLTVPSGYQADTWVGNVATLRDVQGDDPKGSKIFVAVGGGGEAIGQINGQQNASVNGNVGPVNGGAIPVAVFTDRAKPPTVVVNVTCSQINADAAGHGDPYRQWQQNCFDALYSAYTDRLTAFHQERAARAQQDSPYALVVGPPELNLSRSVAELKRLVIADLMGNKFTGFELVDRDGGDPLNEPSIEPSGTELDGEVVQFFEQAFEWENLVYICYPYFWGDHEDWGTSVRWASADPVFDQFLNAGSARVVVPARPGFEHLVNYFLHTGEIWGGHKPPAPNESGYLSIADPERRHRRSPRRILLGGRPANHVPVGRD
jgi:hypothetical protein